MLLPAYETGLHLPTDLPSSNLTLDIDPLTQIQSVESAHELAKEYFEQQGYKVEIAL